MPDVKEKLESETSAALEMSGAEFRELGHHLVDRIADFLDSVAERRRPAMVNLSPEAARARVGQGSLPDQGTDARALLDEAMELAFDGARLNGHPRSWGYIIGTPAPIGILGDFLASAVNPNLAAWNSAPVPTEIEAQAVRWIAELLGYPSDCGGLLTSGGNMANFVGVLAARRAHAPWDVRREGISRTDGPRLRLYASTETHTWVQKAADLFGLGTESIRWVPTDKNLRMDLGALEARIAADKADGDLPFLLIGSAGTVSTGAVDPLPKLAAVARAQDMWFHVDGAYGAPAVMSPDAPDDLKGLREADSIAVDAHKWLFAPLEAGCALVRDRRALKETFSYRPPYYHFPAQDEEILHYHEYGPQNSRCFRALKVWLALRHAGRANYEHMITRNLRLAREMHACLAAAPEIETVTQSLSITTFRFIPAGLDRNAPGAADYLNELNSALLTRIQMGGEAFLSNAVVEDQFILRACITNFRSQESDVRALPELVRRNGSELDRVMRPAELRSGN